MNRMPGSAWNLAYVEGTNGRKGCALLRMNALYDLSRHRHSDAIIQKARELNGHKAFQGLAGRSKITKSPIMAGRGHGSFNGMAHVQEKGGFFWFVSKMAVEQNRGRVFRGH